MPDEDSKKMEEIRKFSAIYGRFDAKRKPEKPLTLHEVCKNSKVFLDAITSPDYVYESFENPIILSITIVRYHQIYIGLI